MRLLGLLVAWIVLLALLLGLFELILHTFHTPFGYSLVEPQAQMQTWEYLLQQHYVSLIDVDLFSIHEKRHLLDVKRLFDRLYLLWLILLAVGSAGGVLLYVRFRSTFKRLRYDLWIMGVGSALLLIMALIFFQESFEWLHQLLFPYQSWLFPPDSLLIEWFPEVYFIEFIGLYLLLLTLLLWWFKPQKKA